MINANIILSNYVDRKGLASVKLQISINRKVKRYALFKCAPADFDSKKQMLKGNHARENAIITETLAKINNINLLLQQHNEKASFITFEAMMQKNSGSVTFEYCMQHYKLRKNATSVIRCFIKFFPECAELDKVTSDIARTFADELSKRYKSSTVHYYIKCLSTLYEKAIERGDTASNPFLKIPTTPIYGERQYLTEDELQLLEHFKFKFDATGRARDAFLFQCYTGLRTSDVRKLKWADIQEDAIRMQQTKTKNSVFIPLSNKAKAILDKQDKGRYYVFSVKTSYQYTVINLIKEAGITKHITPHCGRHTFAVQSLNRRIPIEVVSKLLGHTNIKTTQIYAKITSPLIRDYMKLWD